MTQEKVLKRVISALEDNNIPYMLTGAIAVNYYGRPRLTHDVDIIVNIEKRHIQSLEKAYSVASNIKLENTDKLVKEFEVYEDAIERILGAKKGTINIVNRETLKNFQEKIKT